MSSFILACNDKTKVIRSLSLDKPYPIYLHGDGNKIEICDSELAAKFATKKFTKLYVSYLKKLKEAFDSDDVSGSTAELLLGEIEKLKDILELKYKKFIKKREYEYFLSDINNVSSTLKDELNRLKRKSFRR